MMTKEGRSKWYPRGGAGTAAALMMLLAGCATSPPAQTDAISVEVAPGWQASKAANRPLPDSEWVKSFNDQTLESLVDEARLHNRDLVAAAARIKIAQTNARLAGADLYPMVDAEFAGVRSARNFIGFPFGRSDGEQGVVQSSLSNDFGLSLDLSWEIDLWGRIRAGQSAAIADMEAVMADAAAAEVSVAAQTAKAWFALIEARQQEAQAERTLEIFRRTEGNIRQQFELGLAAEANDLASQLRLAMSDVATAQDNLEQRRETVGQVGRQLEVLLGRYPANEIEGRLTLPAMPKTPPAGLPSELLERRPDVVAAERRLASADKRIDEAKLAVLPQISLTGSYGTSSEEIDNLLDSDFSVWSIAGRALQPILRGGQIRQGIKQRKAELEESLANFDNTALQAFVEVEDALASERYLANREAALTEAERLAREAFEKAEEEYIGGVGDILTILTAQERMVNAEASLITIRRLRLENRVDLHLALGGDFRVRRTIDTENNGQ